MHQQPIYLISPCYIHSLILSPRACVFNPSPFFSAVCNLAEVVNEVPAKTHWQYFFPLCCWILWLYICLLALAHGEPGVGVVLPHACEVKRAREGRGDWTLPGYPAGSEIHVTENSTTLQWKISTTESSFETSTYVSTFGRMYCQGFWRRS